ncbi:MAG: AraC family transcriptional regulator [Acetivibrionales bacterium]|jgi:AraC-like DNA-binding protein/mannose-6-phosphate isomerase-like protein (cupin superfamily)|nr:AraC family transcriptional regulator [Bacillota bacterium]NLP06877.1 AraC family transcriptional regulator [Clostridiaceae bacterium]HOA55820.1 AraC family transcriptional regulator [Clostridiales bacterium]HPZ04759.1 AraC family transcriptional regulator [Clostridiales bacterium]HQD30521.1 AraC family transcriptional regulator [Clostridiales bacterium]
MKLEGLHEKGIFTEHYPFRLVENTIDEFRYPMHWHNAAELVYNASGTCCISVAGSEYELRDGELLLIPAGEIHEIISCSKSGKRYFIQFNISSLDGFGGINDVKPYMEKITKISDDFCPQLRSSVEKCVTELIDEHEKKDHAYELSLNARVFDIIVLISRSLARSSPDFENTRSRTVTGLKQINRAFEYIEKNYPGQITLKDISQAAGFSEYYFSRLFKEYTGQSFLSYLNTYRVKQAEKLLRSTEKSVLEIALDSGFNSLTTFNRIFKKIKGCSPSYYRKAGR